MRAAARRILGAAIAVATSVVAAPAPASEALDKAAAQKLLTQGNQLVGDGDYLAALERFRSAYARFPSAKILLNIGATLRQLGRNVEAAEVYERYLADPQQDPARAVTARRALADIDFVVGRLKIQVGAGSLGAGSPPPPAPTVRLDGKEIPGFQNGVTLRVEPGDHSVVADQQGFPSAVATLRVSAHEERVVSLRLALPEKQQVLIEGPQRTIAYVVGGVGVGGLAAGGVAGLVALLKNKAAAGHCETVGAGSAAKLVCDQQGFDLGRVAKTSATVSTVALAAGGAALVTGVILYFTVPHPVAERSGRGPWVSAQVTAGGARLQLEGSW